MDTSGIEFDEFTKYRGLILILNISRSSNGHFTWRHS